MKIVVGDAATLGFDLDLSHLNALGEVEIHHTTAPDEIAARFDGAEVAIVNKLRMNRDTLGEHPTLKMIAECATGFDNIDLDFCREKGIAVANVKGYSTHSVAQVTLSMALSLSTNLADFRACVASGDYTKVGIANRLEPVFHELYGKTWGVVGAGHIGRQVAAVARAMGCHVIGFSRTPKENIDQVGIDELCRRADIISVHLPLSNETRGIIGEREIALMKKDVILINVARGPVVVTQDLADALNNGVIAGAAIDVFDKEPPLDLNEPLLNCKNCLVTPHIAYASHESMSLRAEIVFDNLAAWLAGAQKNVIL